MATWTTWIQSPRADPSVKSLSVHLPQSDGFSVHVGFLEHAPVMIKGVLVAANCCLLCGLKTIGTCTVFLTT